MHAHPLTDRARIPISNRQQALLEQDIAAEHSTMPYRAPELFDVKTGKTLDEKVDIWSLGCTLYAVAYGFSPFETDGASIAMAVMSGRYRHPGGYSDRVTKLIDAMLVVDPEQRPDIQKVRDSVIHETADYLGYRSHGGVAADRRRQLIARALAEELGVHGRHVAVPAVRDREGEWERQRE